MITHLPHFDREEKGEIQPTSGTWCRPVELLLSKKSRGFLAFLQDAAVQADGWGSGWWSWPHLQQEGSKFFLGCNSMLILTEKYGWFLEVKTHFEAFLSQMNKGTFYLYNREHWSWCRTFSLQSSILSSFFDLFWFSSFPSGSKKLSSLPTVEALDASSDGYDDDNSCRDEDDYYAFLREMAWWLSLVKLCICVSW